MFGVWATIDQIDISTDDEHGNYLGNTDADIDSPHEAFYAYAGPWVSARLLEGAEESVDIDRVMHYLRSSSTDWEKFQKAMGRTDVTDDDVRQAYAGWYFDRGPPPGEVRPDAELAEQWHQDLRNEWPEIEDLAGKLLAEQETITVGPSALRLMASGAPPRS